MIWNINDIQNSSRMLDLLAARNYNYKLPNLIVFTGFLFVFFLSLASLGQVWLPDLLGSLPPYLAAASLIYTLIESWLIDPMVERRSIKGAELIDEFDRDLFGLDKNEHSRSGISRASVFQDAATLEEEKRGGIMDWYSHCLGDLPRDVAALVAQYTATSYDLALRKSYVKYLRVAIVVLFGLIIVIAMAGNIPFHDFVLYVMVPFLPILNWCIKNNVRTAALIEDQRRALKLMEVQWSTICQKQLTGQNLKDALMCNQADLFRRRCSSVLIFPTLYKALRPRLEGHAHRNAEAFVNEYGRPFS